MKSNTVMFKGINIFKYEMNFKEKYLLETMRKELPTTFIDRAFDLGRFSDENEFKFKYNSKMGFFVLFKKNDQWKIVPGFPQLDKENAKKLLLMTEFDANEAQSHE
jgi:hypothetical protein